MYCLVIDNLMSQVIEHIWNMHQIYDAQCFCVSTGFATLHQVPMACWEPPLAGDGVQDSWEKKGAPGDATVPTKTWQQDAQQQE